MHFPKPRTTLAVATPEPLSNALPPLPRVAIVGVGGIGHPAVAALRGMRLELTLIDDDRVERSNLHRLLFAHESDVGRTKIDVARALLLDAGFNDLRCVAARVRPTTALELLSGHDVVLEGSDNFPTKFLVADACALLGIPSIHGAAVGWLGTVFSCVPGTTACYRCLFETPPAGESLDCATVGVHGAVTALVGAIMARAAAGILRRPARGAGVMHGFDGWRSTFRSFDVPRRSDCPLCGTRTIRELREDMYIQPGGTV